MRSRGTVEAALKEVAMRARSSIAVVILALAGAAEAEEAVTLTTIDVVVNVPTIVKEGEASLLAVNVDAAIARANRILKQAGIRLNRVATNATVKDPVANAGNKDYDASYGKEERVKAKEAGAKELDGKLTAPGGAPSGKGIKVYFALAVTASTDTTDHEEGGGETGDGGDTPDSGETAGIAEHYNRTIFVVPEAGVPMDGAHEERATTSNEKGFVDDVNNEVTGERLAHEVVHALSVSAHSTDPRNVMTPTIDPETPPATRMDTKQITEVRKQAENWGTPATKPTPQTPAQGTTPESGGKADAKDDHAGGAGAAHADVAFGGLYCALDDPTLTIQSLMWGFAADGAPVDATYRWLFDADANPRSGPVVAGVPGVEREVVIAVLGGGAGAPLVEARLVDHVLGGIFMPLPGAVFRAEPVFDTGATVPPPVAQRVQVDVPKWMLDLVADVVPVAMRTEGAGGAPSDAIEIAFDRLGAAAPQITVMPPLVRAGDVVSVFAAGLTPGAAAGVRLDDKVVVDGAIVAPDGTLAAAFDLRALPAADDVFFVTVTDAAGRSAFTILSVDPWSDGFEGYPPRSELHGQGGWKGWDGDPAFSAPVSVDEARGSAHSVMIAGDADLVREHEAPGGGGSEGDSGGGGAWSFSAWQYIPAGFISGGGGAFAGSYFILLNDYQDGGPHEAQDWSVQMQFDSNDGLLKVFHGDGTDTIAVPYATDRWVRIRAIVDLDADWARIYYDDALVAEYPWTGGVLGGGDGARDVAAIDLFANGSSPVYYDDLRLEPISGCGGDLASDADGDGLDLLEEFLSGGDPCGG
jgi:hypothetical protein